MTIAVTGSTGGLGGRVARLLADCGIPQRLLVREASRAPALPGTEVAVATYADGAAVEAALRGIETVFMVSASESRDRVAEHLSFVDAAARAGVGHVVYASFTAAAPDAVFTLARDHWATEERLRASGMRCTILRDNLYADALPYLVGSDGVIRGPAGDGRLAGVARDDVGDVAVAILRAPGDHVGATYELTGPAALTMAEIAAVITEVTGRAVTYLDETIPEAYASRASYGAPDWQVDAWVSTYAAIAAGAMGDVSGDVAALSGHPATTLAELLARSGATPW